MAETNVLQKIKDREGEFNSLYARMDGDKDLYYLAPFVLTDANGKAYNNVENITLNDPLTFADRVISFLVSATIQRLVEGESMDDKATSLIEDFLRDMYLEVDERLINRDIPGLYPFLVEQICIRGHIAARCLIRTEGDDFIPDILPCDTRYLTYERGMKGLNWVCHKTTMSSLQVMDEFGLEVTSNDNEVKDYWDTEAEHILINDQEVAENKHKLTYVPFVIQKATRGSMLQDDDALEYAGESIFAANRDLYEQLNKVVSVFATNNMLSHFKPGMMFRTDKEGGRLPSQPPYGEGKVIEVGLNEGFELMPMREAINVARLLYSILDSRLQRGGLPATDYGNLTFPLSAVAITRLTSARDQIFLPRLQGMALFYRDLSRMIIRQYTEQGIEADLGEWGKKKTYSAGDLDGEFRISFKFSATSPEQDAANLAQAEASRPFFSTDTIMRKVLQIDNPEEELQKRWSEMADMKIEPLAFYNMAKSKLELGDEIGAMMIVKYLGISWEQFKSGKINPEAAPKKPAVEPPEGKQLMPLVAQGGGQGGATPRQPEQIAEEV